MFVKNKIGASGQIIAAGSNRCKKMRFWILGGLILISSVLIMALLPFSLIQAEARGT
jgi:hypothetical protein